LFWWHNLEKLGAWEYFAPEISPDCPDGLTL
jgi:hypothetical protein